MKIDILNRDGSTARLDKVKYDWAREAIIKVLSDSPTSLSHVELTSQVESYAKATNAPQEIYPDSGSNSLMWLVKTVQLDLEAREILKREKIKGKLHFSLSESSR